MWPTDLTAIDITALYSTSCQREIGIPLDADVANVYFLGSSGQIKQIPRYQISALATYPMDKIPMRQIRNGLKRQVDYFKVFTKYDNQIIPYIQGHPIQFYQDKISFISDDGDEIVIDRRDIWKIDIENTPQTRTLQGQRTSGRYRFIHPYRQYNCQDRLAGKGRGKAISIYPQEYTSDPVDIKRRMDGITTQLDILRSYRKRQKFYAVPQIYKNLTSLGYWFPLGGRHGSSSGRSNNLTPILSNELSLGPFSYQHIFLSGSTPLNKLVHAEAQTQFYYALKADYFRFSFFLDPNKYLVQSEKYKWQRRDFKKEGGQHFESTAASFGLDFGPLSFGLTTGQLHNGIYRGGDFRKSDSTLNKYYLAYQNHLFSTEMIYGKANSDDYDESNNPIDDDYKHFRYNLKLDLWDDYSASYSLIHYTYRYSGLAKAHGLTNAVYGTYRWSYKYIFKAMLGLEFFGIEGGPSSASLNTGLSANLVF